MTPIMHEITKKWYIKHNEQVKIWNLIVRSIAFTISKDIIENIDRVQKKQNA